MTAQRPEERVRFSREVRIGELVAVIGAIFTLAATYVEIRLQPVQAQIVAMRDAQAAQDERTSAYMRELRSDMRDLGMKLDRVIEGLQQWKR